MGWSISKCAPGNEGPGTDTHASPRHHKSAYQPPHHEDGWEQRDGHQGVVEVRGDGGRAK
jgi:hypothetical protein